MPNSAVPFYRTRAAIRIETYSHLSRWALIHSSARTVGGSRISAADQRGSMADYPGHLVRIRFPSLGGNHRSAIRFCPPAFKFGK